MYFTKFLFDVFFSLPADPTQMSRDKIFVRVTVFSQCGQMVVLILPSDKAKGRSPFKRTGKSGNFPKQGWG